MQNEVKSRPRPIRYSLRGFLFVTLGFSACLGMYLRSARLQHVTVLEIQRAGGSVHYDFEIDDALRFNPGHRSCIPTWLLSARGTDVFHSIVFVQMSDHVERGTLVKPQRVTDEWLRSLDRCRKVRVLVLDGSQLTDGAFAQIGKLRDLELLYVSNAFAVTDAGVFSLKKLRRLRNLNIDDSQIGDHSVATIADLPDLTSLSLHGSNITDEGLRHLATMKRLESLSIGGGPATFTARGLAPLATLQGLNSLDLQSASVSRDGVSELCRLKGLARIHLEHAEIPDIDRLHAALPDCRIYD